MTRRIGLAGLDIIKDSEALRLEAYLPTPKDVPTIGWGHTHGVKLGDFCTRPQAEEWLREDCAGAEHAVEAHVFTPINQNQFDALVSLTFNIGVGNFIASTLLHLINERKYHEAADEFPRWCRQKGKILAGLVTRRARERALFLTP
jgi:lysozyme